MVKTCQEENGDSPVMTLREALQKIEKSGFIDYSVGGHSCTRPADVQAGKADDMFEVKPESGNPLVWKATGISQKQLKVNNIASHFTAMQLDASPLILVLWLCMFKLPFLCFTCWFLKNT